MLKEWSCVKAGPVSLKCKRRGCHSLKEDVEEPVRTGGAIDAKHYNDMSLVVKDDFLVVNGFAYLLKEE